MKNWKTTLQSFRECFSISACFVFCSSNTLYVMSYTYFSYWNTFQCKFDLMREWLQKIFVYSVLHYFFVDYRFVSTSFYFMKLSSCVVWFANISNSPNQIYAKSLHALKTFPNVSFVWLHRKIIWHLDKVNKQVNTESQQLISRSVLVFVVCEFLRPPLFTL